MIRRRLVTTDSLAGMTVSTPRREALGRLMNVIRDIAVGGTASVISGIVVLGFGGRLVMFLSRLLHPEAIGDSLRTATRSASSPLAGPSVCFCSVGLAVV